MKLLLSLTFAALLLSGCDQFSAQAPATARKKPADFVGFRVEVGTTAVERGFKMEEPPPYEKERLEFTVVRTTDDKGLIFGTLGTEELTYYAAAEQLVFTETPPSGVKQVTIIDSTPTPAGGFSCIHYRHVFDPQKPDSEPARKILQGTAYPISGNFKAKLTPATESKQ